MTRSTEGRRRTRSTKRDPSAPGPDAPVIEAIVPHARDPNRRRVRAGGRVVVTLTADAVDVLNLRVGQPWSNDLRARVAERTLFDNAWRSVLRMLSHRALTRAEVAARLTRRNLPPDIVERVLADLTAHGWLDDEQVARDAASSLTARRPMARTALSAHLAARGIDAEVAERAVRDAVAAGQERHSAIEFARARRRGLSRLTPLARMRRVAAALARRGFDEDTIAIALREAGLEVDSVTDEAPRR